MVHTPYVWTPYSWVTSASNFQLFFRCPSLAICSIGCPVASAKCMLRISPGSIWKHQFVWSTNFGWINGAPIFIHFWPDQNIYQKISKMAIKWWKYVEMLVFWMSEISEIHQFPMDWMLPTSNCSNFGLKMVSRRCVGVVPYPHYGTTYTWMIPERNWLVTAYLTILIYRL